jgi:hypothetical protein
MAPTVRLTLITLRSITTGWRFVVQRIGGGRDQLVVERRIEAVILRAAPAERRAVTQRHLVENAADRSTPLAFQ